MKATIFFLIRAFLKRQIIGSSRKKPQETFTKRISLPCTVALGGPKHGFSYNGLNSLTLMCFNTDSRIHKINEEDFCDA